MADNFVPKLIPVKLAVEMSVPAGSTTESLNSNTEFKTSLKTGIVSMLGDSSITSDDIMNLVVTLKRLRTLSASSSDDKNKRLLQTSANLDIEYDLRVRTNTAESALVMYNEKPLSEQSTAFVSSVTTALAANGLASDFAVTGVTSVATEAPQEVPDDTDASGASSLSGMVGVVGVVMVGLWL